MNSIESASNPPRFARVDALTWDGTSGATGSFATPGPASLHIKPATLPKDTTRWRDPARRVLNVVVAAILLVLLLPVLAMIALAVRLSSRGPVIYVQDRVGLDRRRSAKPFVRDRREGDDGGRLFRMYKFRTMYVNSDDQVWARPDDPRVTPVGRFLRLYRLDELPQLVNVLRGEMNIVGPRPEQPRIFQQLRTEIDGYPRRQQVLPGITGWAQINHRYDQCLGDVQAKLVLDLEYLERRSTAEDFRIMVRTAPVMLFKQGAQ